MGLLTRQTIATGSLISNHARTDKTPNRTSCQYDLYVTSSSCSRYHIHSDDRNLTQWKSRSGPRNAFATKIRNGIVADHKENWIKTCITQSTLIKIQGVRRLKSWSCTCSEHFETPRIENSIHIRYNKCAKRDGAP